MAFPRHVRVQSAHGGAILPMGSIESSLSMRSEATMEVSANGDRKQI